MRTPLLADPGALLLGSGLLLAIAIGAVLYFGLGLDLLANPEWGVPCPFHALTGLDCPGCGMTRALVFVSQLQWRLALEMNPLVYPLLGFAVLAVVGRISIQSRSIHPEDRSRAK